MNIIESSHECRDVPVDGRPETENFQFEVGSHTYLLSLCLQYADTTFPRDGHSGHQGCAAFLASRFSPLRTLFSFQDPALFIRSRWIQPSPPTDAYLPNRGLPSSAADPALEGNHVLDPTDLSTLSHFVAFIV